MVTALTNGTTYQVSVRAINAVGDWSGDCSASATPATVPGAPALSATPSPVRTSSCRLRSPRRRPTVDRRSPATTTRPTPARRGDRRGRRVSPIVISTLSVDGTTPLVNGTTYFVELRAINTIGAGTASAVATGIAQTTPSAPGIASVTPGPSSLAVVIHACVQRRRGDHQLRVPARLIGWVDTGTLGNQLPHHRPDQRNAVRRHRACTQRSQAAARVRPDDRHTTHYACAADDHRRCARRPDR